MRDFINEYRNTLLFTLIGIVIIGVVFLIVGALYKDKGEELYDGLKVEVESITSSKIGTAKEIDAPRFTGTKISFDTSFEHVGDQIIYQIYLKNKGSVNAVVDKIKRNFLEGGDFVYEFSEVREGSIVDSGDKMLVVLSVTRIGGADEVMNNNFTVNFEFVETSLSSKDKPSVLPGVTAKSSVSIDTKGSIVNEIIVRGMNNLNVDYISSEEISDQTDIERYKELGFNIYENASEELTAKIDKDKITIYQDVDKRDTGYYVVGLSGITLNGELNRFAVTLYVVSPDADTSFSYACNNLSSNKYTYCGFNNYTMPLNTSFCDESIYICE